jgi:hypothetical protein
MYVSSGFGLLPGCASSVREDAGACACAQGVVGVVLHCSSPCTGYLTRHPVSSRAATSTTRPGWDDVVGMVDRKLDKPKCLPLSRFGRALGATSYVVSKLLFYTELRACPHLVGLFCG